jgi:2,4-dienoyl-CoA reductase-like NADH-dependent reductase (Old Yellow Enzyme family)
MPNLFDPLVVGDLELPNRIVMAPMTRLRGTPEHLPTPIMAEYYRQRAGAGLIITEGIPVSPFGVGYANVPGIWSDEQTEGWKPITQAVHEAGGRIFAQIWHVGRVSHSSFLNGELPVSASAVALEGQISQLRPPVPFETPRALGTEEVYEVIEQYRKGAENAKAAGFDGVEIHGANGYLVDQFLQTGSNHRTDEFGGSLENRARFMLAVADAAISVWGPGRVGMHIAPRGDSHGMMDDNITETFTYVATELGKKKIAFLCAREYNAKDRLGLKLKEAFGGVYIANERYTRETAYRAIVAGEADAVAFGVLFLANPDLPQRFVSGSPLNQPNMATVYSAGAEGYTDYPTAEQLLGK